MKKSNRWIVGALMMCGSLASHAAGEPPGVYASLALGQAHGSGSYYKDGTVPSVGFALGYRLNQNLSVEAYGRSLSFDIFPLYPSTESYPTSHIGVAGIAETTVAESVSLYGRLGVGSTQLTKHQWYQGKVSDTNTHQTEATVGVGAKLRWNSQTSFSLEYLNFTRNKVGVVAVVGTYLF